MRGAATISPVSSFQSSPPARLANIVSALLEVYAAAAPFVGGKRLTIRNKDMSRLRLARRAS